MLLKESKIKVVENFYGIDYVFFGKPLKRIPTCCPVVKEEYISVKGALLSVFVEMMKLMDHKPKVIKEKVKSKKLLEMAKKSAAIARANSKKIVTTELARQDIKNDLKEALEKEPDINISKIVETKIREKAFRLAIDNLLVAKALQEAKSVDAMNEWTGKIVEDSYKILRDSLCELAMMILDESE